MGKMAFQDETETVAEKRNPIFLMTATIKNDYKTSFQPKLQIVHVDKPEAKESSDNVMFLIDDKAKVENSEGTAGNTYLLRMELPPGNYQIRGLSSYAIIFPIRGNYFAPMHSSLKATEPGIYYLGHVNATVRERKENEFKAGPSIPLLDQAIAGASGGTFDVEITDQLATDEPMFRSKFPALANAPIQKTILPAFDRTKAQQWWEAH